MNLVYDEIIGWYDADIEFCSNGCGKRAVGWNLIGMVGDTPLHESACIDCLDVPLGM